MYFTFLENRSIGLPFAVDSIDLSSLKFLFISASWRFGRSRSSKVDEFGVNRKRVCHFLLVRNSNLGPILHRFGATATFMCS